MDTHWSVVRTWSVYYLCLYGSTTRATFAAQGVLSTSTSTTSSWDTATRLRQWTTGTTVGTTTDDPIYGLSLG